MFQRHCQVIEIFEIYMMVGKKKNPVSEGLGHILFFGFNLFLFGSNLCCKYWTLSNGMKLHQHPKEQPNLGVSLLYYINLKSKVYEYYFLFSLLISSFVHFLLTGRYAANRHPTNKNILIRKWGGGFEYAQGRAGLN